MKGLSHWFPLAELDATFLPEKSEVYVIRLRGGLFGRLRGRSDIIYIRKFCESPAKN